MSIEPHPPIFLSVIHSHQRSSWVRLPSRGRERNICVFLTCQSHLSATEPSSLYKEGAGEMAPAQSYVHLGFEYTLALRFGGCKT